MERRRNCYPASTLFSILSTPFVLGFIGWYVLLQLVLSAMQHLSCCFSCSLFSCGLRSEKKGGGGAGGRREGNCAPAAFNSWPGAKSHTAVLRAQCMTTFFHLCFPNTPAPVITLFLNVHYPITQKFFLLQNKITANWCAHKHQSCKNASNATSGNGNLLPHIETVCLEYIITWMYKWNTWLITELQQEKHTLFILIGFHLNGDDMCQLKCCLSLCNRACSQIKNLFCSSS